MQTAEEDHEMWLKLWKKANEWISRFVGNTLFYRSVVSEKCAESFT